MCGTVEYMAPEIYNGQGHGKEADFYSFVIFTEDNNYIQNFLGVD